MALTNNKLKKSLSQTAEDNTTVTRGKKSDQEVLKKGTPNDHSRKHLDGELPTVGVSIGTTLNMDNYESLRVDVWLTDTVKSGESVEQAYQRVVKTVDTTLQKVVEQYTSEG